MRAPLRAAESRSRVEGSRFVAWLGPAADLAAAEAAHRARSEGHPDATHHCWAYRLWADGRPVEAGFDAGEPAGTAGRPILGALERADLVLAVCVVTRWFGGTKLGTGGLARAYADVARAAVEGLAASGSLARVEVRARYAARHDYADAGVVRGVLARYGGREERADYGGAVEAVLTVPVAAAGPFAAALVEATGGRIDLERIADRLAATATGGPGSSAAPA